MIELTAYQAAAADWFLGLEDRRGILALPPGYGKSTIALRIARVASRDGAVLVVVPTRVLASHWAARATAIGLSASTIDPRTSSRDLAEIRDAMAKEVSPGSIWVVTAAQMRRSLPLFTSVSWALSIFDEAHWSAQRLSAQIPGAHPVLLLTATPEALPADLGLPQYRVQGPGLSRINLRQIDVEPNAAEAAFLGVVAAWAARADEDDHEELRLRRSVLARSLTGAIAAVDALEGVLSGSDNDEEDGIAFIPTDVEAGEGGELERLLDLAYEVPLPDTRSLALIATLRELDQAETVLIAERNSQLSYFASLLSRMGIDVFVLSNVSDAAETDVAIRDAREKGLALLVGDGAAAQGVGDGRRVLIHCDLPSDARIATRVGLLVDSAESVPDEVTSIAIRWRLPGTPQRDTEGVSPTRPH